MGFWIYYQYAIKGRKEELKKVQRRLNRFIEKNEGSLNAFRGALDLKPGGMADWIEKFRYKKGVLYAWTGIRCNWDDPVSFGKALRREVGSEPEIYFLVDEGDLDPGNPCPLLTNDTSGTIFPNPCHEPVETINETI